MIAMAIIVCALHLFAAQHIPARRSKGDVLSFRRASRGKRVSPDSESAVPRISPQEMHSHDLEGGIYADRTGEKSQAQKLRIHEQSSVFHWKNLSYEVKVHKGSKKILNNIDGWVKPGTLTALMVFTIQCYKHV